MEKKKIEETVADVLKTISYKSENGLEVDILEIARKYGFVVGNAFLDDKEDGFIIVDEGRKQVLGIETSRLIGVNADNTLENKRFIIAHELGHFLLHYDSREDGPMFAHRENVKGKNKDENDADYFAACLLMPQKAFLQQYNRLKESGENEIAGKLAVLFNVPKSSAERRIDEVLNRG